MKKTATHFICIYLVPCYSIGSQERRIDYCESGVREIKYLDAFKKSVGNEIAATYLMTLKNHP